MNKLQTEDDVIVIAGKDKGRTGRVAKLVGKDRVIVHGINMVKRHTKANPNADQPGGIISREAPLHRSNVAILNPETKRPDRVGIKRLEDGTRVRVYKSDGKTVVR